MKPLHLLLILALGLGLAACGRSMTQDSPIGIGSGPNDLKKSPCVCIILPNGADGEEALT